jgi:hypothetical protein
MKFLQERMAQRAARDSSPPSTAPAPPARTTTAPPEPAPAADAASST